MFYPQTERKTKQENSTIETYLQAFVNFKQNDWAKLLPIAKFTYNNTKNINTSHTPFELNYSYYFQILYKEEINPLLNFKTANKLLVELNKLIIMYYKIYHI